MRQRSWLIIGAISLLLAALAGVVYFARLQSGPSFERTGGVILRYDLAADPVPDDYDPMQMASVLQRYFKAKGLTEAEIRSSDRTGVEIGVAGARPSPSPGVISENEALAMELIAQTGYLEFRPLANEQGDTGAIVAAREMLVGQAEATNLDQRAADGLPPLVPLPLKERYAWIEVGPSLCAGWNLQRTPGLTAHPEHGLLYTRTCTNVNLSAKQQFERGVDVFLLTRSPRRNRVLMGVDVTAVTEKSDESNRAIAVIRFDEKRSEQVGQLKSPPDASRRLALVLDRLVMATPLVAVKSADEIVLTDDSLSKESLAMMLRAGILPAELKPKPSRRTYVKPVAD